MAKWSGVLSTTEPYNHLGLIKVRQNNVNSETFEFKIVENNKPIDLTGLTIYFCAYFDKFSPVEQTAKIKDAKQGVLTYTLNKYDMQGKLRFAYFKFEKEGVMVGSTQNFAYNIIKSIESSCVDAGPYIQRLEDILNAFSSVKEESMKEIQEIIDSFNEQVITQKSEFEKWFDSIKNILESIDPGGVLLSEIVSARSSSMTNMTFSSLKKRLDFSDSVVFKQVPSGFKFIIEHDSEYQPEVLVTSYRNAIGVEKKGFDTTVVFGGDTISNVPTHLSYDRKKAYVEMPLFYALNGTIVIPKNDTLLIIDGVNILCFTVKGASILKGAYPGEEPPLNVQIPRDLEVIALDDNTIKLNWKRGD